MLRWLLMLWLQNVKQLQQQAPSFILTHFVQRKRDWSIAQNSIAADALHFCHFAFCYLDGPRQIWSFEAKVDLTGYGHADEEPVVETEEVDQLEDIGHRQVEQRHGPLREKSHTLEFTKINQRAKTHKNTGTLTLKSRAGIGVKRLMWIMHRMLGRWPSLEPTKNNLQQKTERSLWVCWKRHWLKSWTGSCLQTWKQRWWRSWGLRSRKWPQKWGSAIGPSPVPRLQTSEEWFNTFNAKCFISTLLLRICTWFQAAQSSGCADRTFLLTSAIQISSNGIDNEHDHNSSSV